jgi:hypothetical protein
VFIHLYIDWLIESSSNTCSLLLYIRGTVVLDGETRISQRMYNHKGMSSLKVITANQAY